MLVTLGTAGEFECTTAVLLLGRRTNSHQQTLVRWRRASPIGSQARSMGLHKYEAHMSHEASLKDMSHGASFKDHWHA